jgi:hypothetical protein
MIDVTLCAATLHCKSHPYDILIVGVTSVETEKVSEPQVSGTFPHHAEAISGRVGTSKSIHNGSDGMQMGGAQRHKKEVNNEP